eukprot:1612915-Alexandrium_andersonii.AAC.1
MRTTRSRSSGLSKSHAAPPSPGRKSNTPAGRTPRRGRLSARTLRPPMLAPRQAWLRPQTGPE